MGREISAANRGSTLHWFYNKTGFLVRWFDLDAVPEMVGFVGAKLNLARGSTGIGKAIPIFSSRNSKRRIAIAPTSFGTR
jgi:hypothetical protein